MPVIGVIGIVVFIVFSILVQHNAMDKSEESESESKDKNEVIK